MDKNLSWRMPFVWIASVGGVGFIPFAPGTWGSAVAIALAVPIITLEHSAVFLLGISIGAYFVGQCASAQWLHRTDAQDPSAIVIDEVVGQWLTLAIIAAFMPITYQELLAAFILFRFFDIVKPFPIGWIDSNIKGARGVMLDDIVAGIMAGLVYLLATTFL
ncbi:MAG: phosphatidylglycerophosphatase A [Alphaproteobacteria bacterium]|nr:phosphatidylglycerophosphatase A [Alphaproteobacteria bacterium]MBE8220634.1 phosphatidylglycerophosphatase A [Alphaproteobacteria bacterium]